MSASTPASTSPGSLRPGADPNPFTDRLPDRVLEAADTPLADQLRHIVGARNVLVSATDLTRYATDASPYRMLPQAVVRPRHADDVAALLAWSRRSGHTLTFRSGGTSLNGQSQTDDVLVDMREHFGLNNTRALQVLDGGRRLRAAPGIVLARANAALVRHGRMLGPDPASSAAATIGGVLANNASGMTCGVRFNSYRTIDQVVAVLPSGTRVDTGAPGADARLAASEPALHAELLAIRDELRADKALSDRIRRKFSIKNTSGYRLDAFLDADQPIDILKLLLVGSEGTLGVVVDTTWNTLPTGPLRSTGFLRFADVRTAAAAVPGLIEAQAQAVELLDSASLLALRGNRDTPAWVNALGADATDAVLLIERRTNTEADLDAFEAEVARQVGALVIPTSDTLLTRDPAVAATYWKQRSGLLPIVGAARPEGSALITEDVVVPLDRLPEAVADLQGLLRKHHFTGAVNGHASAGNLHFYLYLDSTDAQQVANYRAIMGELVELVVDRYDGSLKGEHGTGRNMTPFIAREWGEQAMALMWRVKRAFDPLMLLAPGVFLNDDADAAFTNLKSMPTIEAELDPCIECGFCEPVCPSRHITTTPRQRIAVQREMARRPGVDEVYQRLDSEYRYDAVETCAGDSSCALACPVGIDTGHAMKQVRRDGFGETGQRIGAAVASRWGAATTGAKWALGAAKLLRPVVGDRGLTALTGLARRVAGTDLVPSWLPEIPAPPARRRPETSENMAEAVYFPACINRIFGPSASASDDTTVTEALVALARRSGHRLWIPDDVDPLCCGTVWQSKGLDAGNREMAAEMFDAMWRWSDSGRLPIVVDAASCTLGLAHDMVAHLDADRAARHAQLTVLDATTFVRTVLLPDLPARARDALAVVHPTCSMRQLGVDADLVALAGEVADEVYEPIVATCCGFAGDRGMLHPELTETATAEEAFGVRERLAAGVDGVTHFVSGNRTCELGMEHATHRPYESVVVTLERLTRPSEADLDLDGDHVAEG